MNMAEKKKKEKVIFAKAKKKHAVARAALRKGTGILRVNKVRLQVIRPQLVKMLVEEPLLLAGETAKEVDIAVTVKGGGFMGQAMAARGAIAKALARHAKGDALRKTFLKYDRQLLVDDARRKEPKKPLGKGARKKKQSSFR